MFTIKLQQSGDTLNMTIPPETIERLGLHAGQHVTLVERDAGFEVVRSDLELERQLGIAREILVEQHEALELLARR